MTRKPIDEIQIEILQTIATALRASNEINEEILIARKETNRLLAVIADAANDVSRG